jgi:hypothetical protein
MPTQLRKVARKTMLISAYLPHRTHPVPAARPARWQLAVTALLARWPFVVTALLVVLLILAAVQRIR